MTSSINTWDLTYSNNDSDVTRTNVDFKNPLVKIRRVYAKSCYTCLSANNINTLKYFYMGANLVPYNHPTLNDDGMSAIGLFNNDFGYKLFLYNSTSISVKFKMDYM